MFDSLKSVGAMASLMKNKEKIAEAFKRVQSELETRVITVNAPGGAVSVTMNGHFKINDIAIAPEQLAAAAADPQAAARLQQLMAGAVNAANKRVKELIAEAMSAEAKALGLPDMPGLSSLMGGG